MAGILHPLRHLLGLTFFLIVSAQRETTLPSTTEHCVTRTPSPKSLPTLYEYYSKHPHNEPLDLNGTEFHLNGKRVVIYSGSFHYFRVLPERWEETLMKYRSAGLNAVQIYIPWNLHEDTPDRFDFESPNLDLDRLLRLIRKLDMFVIVRPGPYICAEWEWGGLPSWLLRDPTMKIRTTHKYFMDRAAKYFKRLLSIVNRHQWSVFDGPVIMLQLDNEYFGAPADLVPEIEYLRQLRSIVRTSGFKQALFTSDPLGAWNSHDLKATFPEGDVLETANFYQNARKHLQSLRQKQPNRPLFVSEFWSGWFDYWGEEHHKVASKAFQQELEDIVLTSNASVNFYMFFGGTNFGFMNGARVTTSYDYDAPLTEDGRYTQKYEAVQNVYHKMVQSGRMPNLALPKQPELRNDKAITQAEHPVKHYIAFESLLNHASMVKSRTPLTMEQLDLGPNYGQRYGFILYRIRSSFSAHEINVYGQFHDRAMFLCDGIRFSILPDDVENATLNIKPELQSNHSAVTYDFLVENQGRQNNELKMDQERKGLTSASNITLDGKLVTNYEIYSLDFNQTYMAKINKVTPRENIPETVPASQEPALYIATVDFEKVADVWLTLPGWTKGQIFINEFNLGRYWNEKGPQTRFYVPRELLRVGSNYISLV